VAPLNTPKTTADAPQFQARLPWYPHERHGADMLPFPVRYLGETPAPPARAPTVGEHTEQVLADVLGYDPDRIAELQRGGALGDV
jgi:crotonobetainyl-CoA:carnitine CoA-transferase CaiB-like acyl-CoA transferase